MEIKVRGAWEQMCFHNLNAFKRTKLARLHSNMSVIWNHWQDWTYFLLSENVFVPTKRARRLRSHVCVVLHYPMQKNTAAWDKRSPWASARDERGKALAYAEPLLTQHAVFIKWLLGRDRNSQTECENVTTVWFKFLLYGQTVNSAQVAKPPIILLHSAQCFKGFACALWRTLELD